MNTVKTKLISAKNHVVRCRGRYGVAAGLAAGLYINQSAVKEWNSFLEEKGLYDEFYAPE